MSSQDLNKDTDGDGLRLEVLDRVGEEVGVIILIVVQKITVTDHVDDFTKDSC